MIMRWGIIHYPSPKYQQRYKLRVLADTPDLKKLTEGLGNLVGKPFTNLDDKDYNWAFYIYDYTEEKKEQIVKIIDQVSKKKSVSRPPTKIKESSGEKLEDVKGSLEYVLKELIPEKEPSLPVQGEPVTPPETEEVSPPEEKEIPQPVVPAKIQREVKKKVAKILPVEEKELFPEALPLESNYTFERFVVGASNRFTHAAAQAVASNPGSVYNPFFIYGGAGLGKTHLMQAIGHGVKKTHPELKIFYVSSEIFTREVIEAIREARIEQLHEKYRKVDILLLDDIQFLASSEATQKEFFHIFNVLHTNHKQIVVTSDNPPRKLPTLEERLRSRFEWGLTTDIKPPDLETRVAILEEKAKDYNLELPYDIFLYIARNLKSNVREMEGFLKRISAYAVYTKQKPTPEMVKELLEELLPKEEVEKPVVGEKKLPPQEKVAEKKAAPPKIERKIPGVKKPLLVEEEPVDKTLKPISVGYFYPAAQEEEFGIMKKGFIDTLKSHKLKFRLEPLFQQAYQPAPKMDYKSLIELCKKNGVKVALLLGPPATSGISGATFGRSIEDAFKEEQIPYQIIPFDDVRKKYKYLNVVLDILLLGHTPGKK